MVVKLHHSGFVNAHDTYNAISKASNGKIYYILSSDKMDVGCQMYVFDPVTNKISYLADITAKCGEANTNTIPQGKSHVDFYEYNGKLYFATHVGVYEIIDGIERMPVSPSGGYQLYPGGHILAYDLNTGEFEDMGIPCPNEGIVTMAMDTIRGHIYAISWPHGNFIHYNVKTGKLINKGPIAGQGEAGMPGNTYRVLCRSILVDKAGNAYFSNVEGLISKYHPDDETINLLDNVSLKLDYFGKYDINRPGNMGYNWRKILWHNQQNLAYGLHGNSGYLFRFDPQKPIIEVIERLTSEPSRKSGMFDQFTFGYLSFQLSADQQRILYLTGAPIYKKGQRINGNANIYVGSKGDENLHLVSYHISQKKYIDHGPVYYTGGCSPTYVNSMAVSNDGRIFTMGRFKRSGKAVYDLIEIDLQN